jgi:hypothetical protein
VAALTPTTLKLRRIRLFTFSVGIRPLEKPTTTSLPSKAMQRRATSKPSPAR